MQQQLHLGGEDAERPSKGMPQGKPMPEKVIEKQDDEEMAEGKQAPAAPKPPRTAPNPRV